MTRIIIIKDYFRKGNYIMGYPYEENKEKEDTYILEDGDIYTISQLKENGYNVVAVESKEIIKKFTLKAQGVPINCTETQTTPRLFIFKAQEVPITTTGNLPPALAFITFKAKAVPITPLRGIRHLLPALF